MIFAFASNPPLQPTARMGRGRRELAGKDHVVWTVLVGPLNWGIPPLNRKRQVKFSSQICIQRSPVEFLLSVMLVHLQPPKHGKQLQGSIFVSAP